MSMSVKERCLRMLECPVCLKYMVPPILQCRRRHAVCSDCYFKVKCCLLCRGRKGGRCYSMERISMQMELPCANVRDGCRFLAKGIAIKLHEIGCEFNCRRCPLSLFDSCKWSGAVKAMVEHFKVNHPQDVYFEKWPILTAVGMSQRSARQSMSIASAYESVFWLCWDFNEYRDEFRFSVCYYGYPTADVRFSFMVGVYDGDTEREVVVMSAPSYCVKDDQKIVFADHYVSLPFGVISKFLNAKGDLRFLVKILDNKFIAR